MVGAWDKIGAAAKTFDNDEKPGMPERKSGARKAPTGKKGGGTFSKVLDKIRGKRRGLKQ
jgi:hypothetical protein